MFRSLVQAEANIKGTTLTKEEEDRQSLDLRRKVVGYIRARPQKYRTSWKHLVNATSDYTMGNLTVRQYVSKMSMPETFATELELRIASKLLQRMICVHNGPVNSPGPGMVIGPVDESNVGPGRSMIHVHLRDLHYNPYLKQKGGPVAANAPAGSRRIVRVKKHQPNKQPNVKVASPVRSPPRRSPPRPAPQPITRSNGKPGTVTRRMVRVRRGQRQPPPLTQSPQVRNSRNSRNQNIIKYQREIESLQTLRNQNANIIAALHANKQRALDNKVKMQRERNQIRNKLRLLEAYLQEKENVVARNNNAKKNRNRLTNLYYRGIA